MHPFILNHLWAKSNIIRPKLRLRRKFSNLKSVLALGSFRISSPLYLYSVRGLERSELGRSHGCPGRICDRFYDRSTRTIVGTMLWTEYRPVIKIGPKGALDSHEIRPIHYAPSLGQSITSLLNQRRNYYHYNWYQTCLVMLKNGKALIMEQDFGNMPHMTRLISDWYTLVHKFMVYGPI